MLGEELLDLEDSGSSPVLEPGVGEIVFDRVKAAFAHGAIIGMRADGLDG